MLLLFKKKKKKNHETKNLLQKFDSFKTILLRHRNFWLPIMMEKNISDPLKIAMYLAHRSASSVHKMLSHP